MVFILSSLWWRRIRGLWKLPGGRDWLWVKLGLALVDKAMLSKSLIQFSADEWGCVPSLYFGLRPNYGRGNDLAPKGLLPACCGSLDGCSQRPWPHGRPLLTHASAETPGHSQASLAQSPVGSLLRSPGSWCAQVFVVPSKSLFPLGFSVPLPDPQVR